jgi:hypothetical protein
MYSYMNVVRIGIHGGELSLVSKLQEAFKYVKCHVVLRNPVSPGGL